MSDSEGRVAARPGGTGPSFRLHTDGASRGNPGPAAIGVVIADADTGAVLEEISRAIGRTTNNVAEYQALLAGLRRALDLGAATVEVWSDSELLVRQMQGVYQVKHPALAPLHREALALGRRLPAGLRMRHTMRGGNARADELANLALDAKVTGGAAPPARGVPGRVPRAGPRDAATSAHGGPKASPSPAATAASGAADASARGDGGPRPERTESGAEGAAALAGAGLDALGIAATLPGGGAAEIGPGLRVARLDAGQDRDCPWGLVLRGRVEVGGRPVEPGQGWREPCRYRAAAPDGAVVLECWSRR